MQVQKFTGYVPNLTIVSGQGCGISIQVVMPGQSGRASVPSHVPSNPVAVPLIGLLYGDGDLGTTTAEEFAVLPLLLTRGASDGWEQVLNWIQVPRVRLHLFDCVICRRRALIAAWQSYGWLPLCWVDWLQIGWACILVCCLLGGIVSCLYAATAGRPVELTFRIGQAAIEGIKHLTVTFASDAIHRLQRRYSKDFVCNELSATVQYCHSWQQGRQTRARSLDFSWLSGWMCSGRYSTDEGLRSSLQSKLSFQPIWWVHVGRSTANF